ncbi:ABC-2 type transport system permease protein [Actinomadura pelletieri DSM 43383]|uniref:ABC-2 type transport system permease protein n=1 Tax=Actinomadura pelletieri DSM 43383 TaxID=1120940 RepID=A0A495QMV3_9ACTN|nr:ABC transporter permease [Actinomadura pelletieri]RKS74271.1 ABC-2 type transport system permease protein [Actinomadura pelletieri DSM 43383]
MTADVGSSARGTRRPALGPPGGGGFAGAVGAEWLKLWTVRSTWACLLSAIVLQIGYAVIVGVASRSPERGSASDVSSLTAPETAVGGILYMAQFAIVALAALSITSEYTTGAIGSSLLCVPVRGRLLAAKSLVVSLTFFAAGVPIALLGMVAVAMTMGSSEARATGGDVVVFALAIGAYLALVAVLVIGAGAVMRSLAGTLTAVAVIMLVVPVGLMLTKADALVAAANGLPGPAGLHLMYGGTGPYGRGAACLVLAGWAALVQAAGYVVLRIRDA